MIELLPMEPMGPSEARECVEAINRHMDGARRLLLDLYEREGWRALGYASWRECVVAEFHQSQAYLYYQLDAARIERQISTIVETGDAPQLPEFHLRQIAALPATDRREVMLAIAHSPDLSIKDHRRIIADKQREVADREQVLPTQTAPAGHIPPNCQAEVGDARHLRLEDGSVHLIVTSPPYNARLSYNGYEDWLPWEDYWHGLIEPSVREMFRVLAHGGRLALNMANVVRQDVPVPGHVGRPTQYQSRNHPWKWKPPGAGGDSWALMLAPRIWALLEDIGFLPREQLTWVKGPSTDDDNTALPTSSAAWGTWCSADNPVLRAVAEPVFIASKGTHSRGPGESDLSPDEFKRFTKNVWFVSALKPDIDHPAGFPEELPRRLIKLYSYPGDTVVDPFMGSGTTLVAAARLGRWAYGCDVSEHYVHLARQRLADEMGGI
jgi:site-specific DNA-methyltransferase (adenine-specific)